jgi:hypothetical protein
MPLTVQSAAQKIGIARAERLRRCQLSELLGLFGPRSTSFGLFGPSSSFLGLFRSFLGLSNFGFFARFWSHIPPKKSRAREKKSGQVGHPKMVEKIRDNSDLLTNREFWLSQFHHFFWRNFHKLFDFCHEIFDFLSTTSELQNRAKRPKLDQKGPKRPKKAEKDQKRPKRPKRPKACG